MAQHEEMTKSEIFQLLGEYKFTEDEMRKIIQQLPSRDFESVLNFIEDYRTKQGDWKEDDQVKMLEELKKRNDIQRMENEKLERYRILLREKIAANRKEQHEKNEKETKVVKVEDLPDKIDEEIKIRVYVPDTDSEIYFGFKNNATVKDLYSKIGSKIDAIVFQLLIFGQGIEVNVSDKLILEEFNAKSVMLEIKKNK